MSDNQTPTGDQNDAGDNPEGQTPQEGEQTPKETQNKGDLPDWARQEITDANNEAARYRVEKNDAVAAGKAQVQQEYEAKLADAQTRQDEIQADLDVALVENKKLIAAINQGIPTDAIVDFASLLNGTSDEELSSHAEKVKALFAKTPRKDPPTDPSQGSGNHMPLNGDPILDAIKRAVRA